MALRQLTVVMIIPTGVGATVGGFAGDATPQMNLLASLSDVLITHPNVANAAGLQNLPANALYVEGYALDQFFKGEWVFRPIQQHRPRHHRIGVILDKGMQASMRTLHQNTVNAVKSVYGLSILAPIDTTEAVQVQCGFLPSGSSSGSLENPETILEAAAGLIAQGATAIALCVCMPELTGETAYANGQGVDPVGGIEALLSHLIVSEFQIPCAHSPVFSLEASVDEWHQLVDPRAAAEFITPTFLPCVLTGLSQAPLFLHQEDKTVFDMSVEDVDALVVPANALGGIPVLCALERKIPVIAVLENQTVLDVGQDFMGDGLTIAQSYAEAAGFLQQLKLGMPLPTSNVKETVQA